MILQLGSFIVPVVLVSYFYVFKLLTLGCGNGPARHGEIALKSCVLAKGIAVHSEVADMLLRECC